MICMLYKALGPTGPGRPDFPTDEAVVFSVQRFCKRTQSPPQFVIQTDASERLLCTFMLYRQRAG